MTNKKTPEIRFKGFEDEWELYELGEFAEEIIRNDPTSTAPIMMITAQNGFIEQSKRYSFNNSGESLAKYTLLKKNELAYNHGASKMRPYGSCFALPCDEARIPFVYHCFSVKNNNPEFVSFYLNGSNVSNQLRKIVSSGARMDGLLNISYEDYSTMILKCPKTREQEKIVDSLNTLDNLVVLQQTKLEKLIILKNSMLEKMFPKDDVTVPEIRFGGFSGKWEKRKLGEVATKSNEKNVQYAYSETFTNSAEYGVISQRDFFDHDISKVNNIGGYYVVKKEDFVYNPRISVTAPCGPINCNRLGRVGIISPLYMVFETHDINKLYLEWFFKSNHWHSFMYFNGDSGARSDRFSIKKEVFFEMPVPYPSLEEQEKIGLQFQELDNLITKSQHKLEKLKHIKGACLEKMFV